MDGMIAIGSLLYQRTFLFFVLVILLWFLGNVAVADSMRAPWEPAANNSREELVKNPSFVSLPALALLRFYQLVISPTKGLYCPMYPSCSHYSVEAIQRYGLLLGLLMTADRLHRCGHDIHQYRVIDTPEGARYADPVHLNTIRYYHR